MEGGIFPEADLNADPALPTDKGWPEQFESS